MMLIGYLMLKTQNLRVVVSLYWEVQEYHGNCHTPSLIRLDWRVRTGSGMFTEL